MCSARQGFRFVGEAENCQHPLTGTIANVGNLTAISGCAAVLGTGLIRIRRYPILYLMRGSTRARMIIESTNLTLAGLNTGKDAEMRPIDGRPHTSNCASDVKGDL